MSREVPRFSVEPVPECHPDIGLWLAILNDARERMQFALRGLMLAELDAKPAIGLNTIGTLLYHVALTDLNWVYDNLLKEPYPDDVKHLFPFPLTDEQGRLSVVTGWDLEAYGERLGAARVKVHQIFKQMTVEYFREVVRRDEDYGTYEMTPESILRHLAQHESEHRGEIQLFIGVLRGQSELPA
jgi:uncharacterized damage-inducible protein DinB